MSVIMTLKLTGDPAQFESAARDQADRVNSILELAKSKGLIAHRWYGRDGEFMAIDEWPDEQSFNEFFQEAGPDVGPLMEAAGIKEEPSPTFWTKIEVGDDYGWGA